MYVQESLTKYGSCISEKHHAWEDPGLEIGGSVIVAVLNVHQSLTYLFLY
jgi:hypothetical protein